jgi:DNA primase
MEIERVGFVDAVRMVAERVGIALPEPSQADFERVTENESIYNALRVAGRFFHDRLVNSDEGRERGLSYFQKRGFEPDTMRFFGLGYAPDSWDGLLTHAEKEHVSVEYLERAGLVIPRKGERGFYDRFRGRVMFPLMSHVGRVVGFAGRTLSSDASEAKYINSPETEVYRKGRMLYGLHQSKNHIREEGSAILVEGYTDIISLYQAGVRNTVASSGTALTSHQVKLLRRYAERVILLFDADSAGANATLRSIDLLLESDVGVRVVQLPPDSDPDTFVRERGGDAFRIYLHDKQRDAIGFQIALARSRGDLSDPDYEWRIVQAALQSISLIPNPIKQDGYLRKTAERLSIPEFKLREELGRMLRSKRRPRSRPSGPAPAPAPESRPVESVSERPQDPNEPLTQEKTLIRLMLEREGPLIEYILGNTALEEFSEGVSRKTVTSILDMYQKGELDEDVFLEGTFGTDVQEFVAGILLEREQPSANWRSRHNISVPELNADARKAAMYAMTYLKLNRVGDAIDALKQRIFEAQSGGEDLKDLLSEMESLKDLRRHIRSREFLRDDDAPS